MHDYISKRYNDKPLKLSYDTIKYINLTYINIFTYSMHYKLRVGQFLDPDQLIHHTYHEWRQELQKYDSTKLLWNDLFKLHGKTCKNDVFCGFD